MTVTRPDTPNNNVFADPEVDAPSVPTVEYNNSGALHFTVENLEEYVEYNIEVCSQWNQT